MVNLPAPSTLGLSCVATVAAALPPAPCIYHPGAEASYGGVVTGVGGCGGLNGGDAGVADVPGGYVTAADEAAVGHGSGIARYKNVSAYCAIAATI